MGEEPRAFPPSCHSVPSMPSTILVARIIDVIDNLYEAKTWGRVCGCGQPGLSLTLGEGLCHGQPGLSLTWGMGGTLL